MVTLQMPGDTAAPGVEKSELHVVAFYEDFHTGEWAKEIFDRIRSQMPRDVNARPSLWRFDVIEDLHWGTLAAADVATAAVIIVATRGTAPLPKRLLDCIEKALAQNRSARIGLVAVLERADQPSKDILPAYRQLQAVSQNARLRFFTLTAANLASTPVREETFRFSSKGPLDQSLTMKFSSYRGWGIND